MNSFPRGHLLARRPFYENAENKEETIVVVGFQLFEEIERQGVKVILVFPFSRQKLMVFQRSKDKGDHTKCCFLVMIKEKARDVQESFVRVSSTDNMSYCESVCLEVRCSLLGANFRVWSVKVDRSQPSHISFLGDLRSAAC